MPSRVAVLALVVLSYVTGCDKKAAAPKDQPSPAAGADEKQAPPVALGDLSTSLAAVRTAFNAHKGEARFLTLLSPT